MCGRFGGGGRDEIETDFSHNYRGCMGDLVVVVGMKLKQIFHTTIGDVWEIWWWW